MKPICFLDVDGVINACPPLPEEDTEILFHAIARGSQSFPICYSHGMKDRVRRLAQHFDMVWLTTWEHDANINFIEHFIEPEGEHWPVVEWSRHRWKMWGADAWMKETGNEGRPFVQIDDDLHFEQEELLLRGGVDSRFPQEKLFIAPDIRLGLTDEQVDQAIEWAEGLE